MTENNVVLNEEEVVYTDEYQNEDQNEGTYSAAKEGVIIAGIATGGYVLGKLLEKPAKKIKDKVVTKINSFKAKRAEKKASKETAVEQPKVVDNVDAE